MRYLISRVSRSFLKLLFEQTIPILFLLFSIGVAVALANMSILWNNLIKAQAEAEKSRFSIHFTARPPALKARLDRLYQSIKA